jgi:hypothetical protein
MNCRNVTSPALEKSFPPQHEAHFPLTPALSPVERENRFQIL